MALECEPQDAMNIAADIAAPRSSRTAVEVLRQLHRWVSIVLAAFLLLIACTGTALQAIMVIYGDPGPARFHRLPPTLGLARVWLFNIHTMFFTGVGSAYYGMACGLVLLFLSISGLWMYVRLHRDRAALGRGGLFWSTRSGPGAAMRSLHRWFTVTLVLFTTMIGFTGASLDLDTARNPVLLYDTPLPGAPPGLSHPSEGPPPPWHDINFNLHKLGYLGRTGHVLGVVIGLGLIMFAVTGMWMYGAMYLRRRSAARRALFW